MDDSNDRLRLWLTFGIAAAGIVAVMVAFFAAVLIFKNAKSPGELIPAVLGGVTAAVGTLAGLVAGHAAGAAGKERAENRADASAKQAAAGKVLAEAVKGGTELPGADDEGYESLAPAEQSARAAFVLRQHAQLASQLFP